MEYHNYYLINPRAIVPPISQMLEKVTSPKEFGQKYINSNKRRKRR